MFPCPAGCVFSFGRKSSSSNRSSRRVLCLIVQPVVSADPGCARGSAPGNKTRVCHRQLLLLLLLLLRDIFGTKFGGVLLFRVGFEKNVWLLVSCLGGWFLARQQQQHQQMRAPASPPPEQQQQQMQLQYSRNSKSSSSSCFRKNVWLLVSCLGGWFMARQEQQQHQQMRAPAPEQQQQPQQQQGETGGKGSYNHFFLWVSEE